MSESQSPPGVQKTYYKRAAFAYAFYGVVYLLGALLELDESRKVSAWGIVPWWVFYVLGAAFIMTFPVFIARGVRWFTLTLVFFTAGKGAWLCWLQGRHLAVGEPTSPYNWFFAVVAVCAAVFLLRAGLRPIDDAEAG